jgi:hypothetical protein
MLIDDTGEALKIVISKKRINISLAVMQRHQNKPGQGDGQKN